MIFEAEIKEHTEAGVNFFTLLLSAPSLNDAVTTINYSEKLKNFEICSIAKKADTKMFDGYQLTE